MVFKPIVGGVGAGRGTGFWSQFSISRTGDSMALVLCLPLTFPFLSYFIVVHFTVLAAVLEIKSKQTLFLGLV